MNTQIAEYSATAAALADLTDIYKGVVYDVATTKGMAEAKEGRKELRTLRVDLEKMRVSIKAPALERCRLIDAEAKEITAQLVALEDPIDAQIKSEENREKEAAMAKAVAERQAIEAAEAAAKALRDEEERKIREAEQAKIAAERAEIARIQAEQAEQQRKLDEQAKAARELIEAAERASRLKIEEEQRAARLAQEAIEAEARKAREVEEAKLKAERDRLEQERMAAELAARKLREEQEAAERAERERLAAIAREAQRQENMKLDGKEMLSAFVKQYGEIAEFAVIVKAISKFLKG